MGDGRERGDRSGSGGEASHLEQAVRSRVDVGDLSGATEAALALYGAEVFGFMAGVLNDRDEARDVYSRFSERLWQGIGKFRWECSLRTWGYAIARNELARHRAAGACKAARDRPLSGAGSFPAPEPTTVPPFQRTTLHNAIAALRRELPDDDRELLVLRVDRDLSWRDVALSFVGVDALPDDVERECARLRQRFQIIKKQLKKVAAAQGFIHPSEDHANVRTQAGGNVVPLRRPGGRGLR